MNSKNLFKILFISFACSCDSSASSLISSALNEIKIALPGADQIHSMATEIYQQLSKQPEADQKPTDTSRSPLTVLDDGESIFEPQVFEAGCYYNDSLSDHAPVIYGDFATWNIASPANHWRIIPDPSTPEKNFFNHKFFTDSDGNLLDKQGNKVGFKGTSEVILVPPQGKRKGFAIITDLYVDRLKKVAQAVKNFFLKRSDLKYVVLQEVPGPFEKTNTGVNIHDELKKAFAPASDLDPELSITFNSTNPSGNPLKEEMAAPELETIKKRFAWVDVAIVSRKDANLDQEIVDHYNRFVPFCKKDQKTCFISAHMPYTETDADLEGRCKSFKNHIMRLMDQGYNHFKIAGDFNTEANRIANVCKDLLSFKNAGITIHTSKDAKGGSCSTNTGEITPHNIDLFIEIKTH